MQPIVDKKLVNNVSIGERIIELRKEANLSQGQLASLLSVSRQAVSKWENDLSSPDTLKLIQLSDVLSTDVEYLATGKHIEKPDPIVIKTVEYQEKIVEKPVLKFVEKPITRIVEKEIEKPVIKKVTRIKYYRNPFEYFLVVFISVALGFLFGKII